MSQYMMEEMYIRLFKENRCNTLLSREHLMALVDLALDMKDMEWFYDLTSRLKAVE